MAEGVAGCIFYDSGFTDCGFYGFLHETFVNVMFCDENSFQLVQFFLKSGVFLDGLLGGGKFFCSAGFCGSGVMLNKPV